MESYGAALDTLGTRSAAAADDIVAILRVVHDWWLRHGTWPKPSQIDRDPDGPIAPDRVGDAWVAADRQGLLVHEGGMGRLGLTLNTLSCFELSERRVRHLASLLDVMVRDVRELAHDEEPYRRYTPRQVMKALHVSLADVHSLAQVVAPSRLVGQPWFDPWHPDLNKHRTDEELIDEPMFSTIFEYPKVIASGSGRAYLAQHYGVGSLPYSWKSAPPAEPIPVVLEIDRQTRSVWLDGVPVDLRGLYFDNFALLVKREGALVRYADADLRYRGENEQANVQEQFRLIRGELDNASEAGKLRGLDAKQHIKNVPGRGYRWQSESGVWRLETRFV